MNFPDALFPQAWALGAFVPLVVVWLWCIATAPWRRLADSGQLNVWLGTVVLLVLAWSMKAGVQPGLNLHLLGATVFTLMFGRQLAIIGLSLVLAGVTLNGELLGRAGWLAYGLNALVLAVFPVLLADAIRRGVRRWLPGNFFVFVFVTAFFGAAATVMATGLLASAMLWLAAVYPAPTLLGDYLPYYFLLGFAEAWLNGALITLMVVYVPHWVGSFDDRHYLSH
ncbi:MAG: energy-coupling factor ABC transporter permease [Sterolibacteriaceae bacterium]|nr:energy-coupling factor ABC transporter permease [Sterolibacteriaceae bacterium]